MRIKGIYLEARKDAVSDAYRPAIRVTRQRVRHEVVLHLSSWTIALLLPVDGFTGGTLQPITLDETKKFAYYINKLQR